MAFVFNRLEKSLYKVFENVGINQFLEFVKNPDRDAHSVGLFVSEIEFDMPMVRLRIDIDYETITVEGTDNL